MNRIKRKNKIRVLSAISGGIDSSVCSALLKEQGYDVVGIFMRISDNSFKSEKKARLVAKRLNIPLRVLDLRKEFRKKVIDYFIKEYKAGRTPNPCVVCNYEIKFEILIKKALSLKADFIATGHYARIKNGKLLKGVDKEKDQSYFLWKLKKKQLEEILFPIGGYEKKQVREIAKEFNLPTAEYPESQEVCFIDGTVNNFLKKYLKTKPGKILDMNRKEIGTHNGLWFYTIGQRKGIGISGGPYYVVNKDFRSNNLIVSKNSRDLYKKELTAGNVNWIDSLKFPSKVMAKIRYRSALSPAVISKKKGKIKVAFLKSQKAITPGQSVVFYRNQQLLGGGIIE
jgi:tRNA-uridine 2-sulfurtransferase